MDNSIISQLPPLFLDRIKGYLSSNDYSLFLKSLEQDEKKGLVLDINRLKNTINTMNNK